MPEDELNGLDQTLPESGKTDSAASGVGEPEEPVGPALLDGNGRRYQLDAECGRGGLGRVLDAYDRTLGRPSVVKELLAETEQHQRRFEREALITARLQHPSIVPVHDAGRRADGKLYYAMKKVQGRPLSSVIADTTTLPERLALVPSVVAVAEAMAYAHAHKIVHRDLKPSNVMIGDYGETVVIDRGLAKSLDEPEDSYDTLEAGTDSESSVTIAG